MIARVEQDRHHACAPGRCLFGKPNCIPRRSWYLRTRNSAGRRVSISYKTEHEAREAAAKVLAAATLGVDYQPRAVASPLVARFSEVATEAMKLYASTMSPRASTLANHEWFLRMHLIPHFGHKPITSITTLEVQQFIADKRADLSDSSIKTSLPTLKLVLDHAVKRGLLPINPARSRERLWRPKPTEPVEAFTASELRSILAAAREINLHFMVLIQVMAQGGLRPGEALAIRRQDVSAAGTVRVEASQSRFGGRGPTKNAYSMRKVSVLHPVTEDRPVWRPQDAGDATRRVLGGLDLLTVLAPDAESRLWPISAMHFHRTWKKVLKAARVPHRKPHALRHSFTSILLSRGANLLYVQKAGGWKDANVLLKVYAKWMPEESETNMLVNGDATPRLVEDEELGWYSFA